MSYSNLNNYICDPLTDKSIDVTGELIHDAFIQSVCGSAWSVCVVGSVCVFVCVSVCVCLFVCQ